MKINSYKNILHYIFKNKNIELKPCLMNKYTSMTSSLIRSSYFNDLQNNVQNSQLHVNRKQVT